MLYERLEVLKDTEKSKVYLIYNPNQHQMQMEKHLSGELEIYRRLQNLVHPYLPKLYDVRFENGETILWEEYIAGGSLAMAKANEKQKTLWFLEVCKVLGFLHQQGILHRDVKPSNILLGNDGHIRLIDFDAAREEKKEAAHDTRLLGTRGYAPPEQYGFSQTDERTDIYALGITFKELLGDAAKKQRWKYLLKRCTALEPKRRYRNIRQVQIAYYTGWIRRHIIFPVFIVFFTLFAGFTGWSYITDADVKTAMDTVLASRRNLIFDTVDIKELKDSDVELEAFYGNYPEIYERIIMACPEGIFIATGYTNENKDLLFGKFSTQYDYMTGEWYYSSFEGLYYITEELELRSIPPDECEPYAPAVLKLYQLDVFDTPLI